MEDKHIGYVVATFSDDVRQEVIEWSQQFEKSFFSAVVDGKVEGGNVTDKLHLTLLYGFDGDKINTGELLQSLEYLKSESLTVEGIGTFPVPQYGAKVLFLKVKDNEKLQKMHKDLQKYPHFGEYQRDVFVPHITIGFVRDTFDESTVHYDGPTNLPIVSINYYTKGDSTGVEN